MSQDPDPEKVVEAWLERDLSLAVANGELPPAFEVDEPVDRLSSFVAAGRHPVVVGEPGVGKTAVVYEVIRRALAGTGPAPLAGKRLLPLSLHRRASALKDVDQMRPEMQQLADALHRMGPPVVPYFRDVHLAHQFDIGPQLVSLALRLPGPILGEGAERSVRAMFEVHPELDEHYVLVTVDEPDLAVMGRLLDAWSRLQADRHGRHFTPEALSQTLQLTHRFLARSRLPRKAVDLLA
jgi:ATP-dependent Clp protease ATP-binding subunit ClpC